MLLRCNNYDIALRMLRFCISKALLDVFLFCFSPACYYFFLFINKYILNIKYQ